MSRMQSFSAMADLELARMNDTAAGAGPSVYPGVVPPHHELRVSGRAQRRCANR